MIVALITARGGSKGLPGKNMLDLAGKPLIAHTFEAAQNTLEFDKIILSTDIPEAITLANKHFSRIETPFIRPDHLCLDNSSHSDVVRHAIQFLAEYNTPATHIVLLQPTSPFRRKEELIKGVELLKNGQDSVLGVSKVLHHPAEYLYKNTEGKLTFIMAEWAGKRRQEYPEVWFDNGAFYGFSVSWFLKSGKFFDDNSALLEMSELSLIDIDTEFDLALAKGVATHYQGRND